MTKIKLLIVLATLSLGLVSVSAQTGTNAPSIWTDLEQVGLDLYNASPTNLGFYPYGTYVLSAHKAGGGLALVYDVNPTDTLKVGVLAGVDYIDQFLGLNGGVQISLPIHPLARYGLTNFAVVPVAISALGTPLQGTSNNGGIETINSAGLALEFGHFLGGRFSAGGLYGTRTGAGGAASSGTTPGGGYPLPKSTTYNGGYLNFFIGWQRGF